MALQWKLEPWARPTFSTRDYITSSILATAGAKEKRAVSVSLSKLGMSRAHIRYDPGITAYDSFLVALRGKGANY